MEFTFSDDQDALRETVRAFLGKESPSAYDLVVELRT